jgi:hypothetical protein
MFGEIISILMAMLHHPRVLSTDIMSVEDSTQPLTTIMSSTSLTTLKP